LFIFKETDFSKIRIKNTVGSNTVQAISCKIKTELLLCHSSEERQMPVCLKYCFCIVTSISFISIPQRGQEYIHAVPSSAEKPIGL
jgi:hypothetical protein